MGSYMNFKNFGETPQNQGTGSKPVVSTPLVHQSSVFSLTFDEFQNTLGGSGKDFGSMNMDELLKNIWTAEETQTMAMSAVLVQGSCNNNISSGNLQRQGSLTLPRTLSQKTVDEVWRDLFNENFGVKDASKPSLGPNLQQQQRQSTLGEITLEEFLFRAGVVREDAQQMAMPNNNGFYGGVASQPNSNNTGLTIGFQQSAQNDMGMNNGVFNNNNVVPNQPSSLPMNVSGIRPSQQLPQPLFPKQATVTFTSSMPMVNNTQLGSPGTRVPIGGIENPAVNNGLYQGGTLGMGGLASGAKMGAAMGSPVNQLSPDVTPRSNGDTSSVSPPLYTVTGTRGRKSGSLEKAMERRHRRMIKNRESAARSRARKQAYTLELEAEVAKLKEMNDELRKKQDEFMEMHKDQALETTKTSWGSKRRCLRRTLTGPW